MTQVFLYNENPISFQVGGETMVSATQMAKLFNKRPNDYLGLQSTKELVKAITRKTGKSDNQLVTSKTGSAENGGGTWMHETIALDFAQWLSVDFRLWCIDRTKELLQFGLTATDEMLIKATTDPEFVMLMIDSLKHKRRENLELIELNRTLEAQIAENAPKVNFYDNVTEINRKSEKQKTFIISKIATRLKTNPQYLNKLLINNKVIMRVDNGFDIHPQYRDADLAERRTINKNKLNENGEWVAFENQFLTYTHAGVQFIEDLLKQNPKKKK